MKTYTETVNMLAHRAFDRYMQGDYPSVLDDTGLVAKIYERDMAEVEKAVFASYEHIKAAYYESVNC